jgi:hypothetical protein
VDEWVAILLRAAANSLQPDSGAIRCAIEEPDVSSTATEVSVFAPTAEFSQIFGEPALVGQEKLEVYNQFLLLIASSIKPTDPIGRFLTRDVPDLMWDIRRERTIKADIIKYYQKEIVRGAH